MTKQVPFDEGAEVSIPKISNENADEKSCGCIILKNDKVLLIGARDDDGNLYWSFPKGHQEEGETDIETALRETREEVGLDVEVINNTPIKTWHEPGMMMVTCTGRFQKGIKKKARLILRPHCEKLGKKLGWMLRLLTIRQ